MKSILVACALLLTAFTVINAQNYNQNINYTRNTQFSGRTVVKDTCLVIRLGSDSIVISIHSDTAYIESSTQTLVLSPAPSSLAPIVNGNVQFNDSVAIEGLLTVNGGAFLGDVITLGTGVGKPNRTPLAVDTNGNIFPDTASNACQCIDTTENGLTNTNGNLQLGGTLKANTSINLAGNRFRFVNGTSDFFTLLGDALLPAAYNGLYYIKNASSAGYFVKVDSSRTGIGWSHQSNGSYSTLYFNPYAGSSPLTPNIQLQTTRSNTALRSGISADWRSTEIFLLDPTTGADVVQVQVDSANRTARVQSLNAANVVASEMAVDTFGIKFIHNNSLSKGYIFPTDTPTAVGQTINVTGTDGAGSYTTSWGAASADNIYSANGEISAALRIVTVPENKKLLFNGDGELEIATVGGIALTSDSPVVVQADITASNFYSGTYTPVKTDSSNVDSASFRPAQYVRTANFVTVSGSFSLDPTAATSTTLQFTLPIASNLTQTFQVGGTANNANGDSAAIGGEATDNDAVLSFTAGGTGVRTWYYTFSYLIQ